MNNYMIYGNSTLFFFVFSPYKVVGLVDVAEPIVLLDYRLPFAFSRVIPVEINLDVINSFILVFLMRN